MSKGQLDEKLVGFLSIAHTDFVIKFSSVCFDKYNSALSNCSFLNVFNPRKKYFKRHRGQNMLC